VTSPNDIPKPRPTEPLPPPKLYAVELPVGLHSCWREAVRALDDPAFAKAMRAAGITPDGKEALIAWLRCEATRNLLRAFRLRHRAERDRLLDQELGFWDNAHVAAIDAALGDRPQHVQLVDLMLREMRRSMRG
jgi:hypothetical protein